MLYLHHALVCTRFLKGYVEGVGGLSCVVMAVVIITITKRWFSTRGKESVISRSGVSCGVSVVVPQVGVVVGVALSW